VLKTQDMFFYERMSPVASGVDSPLTPQHLSSRPRTFQHYNSAISSQMPTLTTKNSIVTRVLKVSQMERSVGCFI